MICSRCGWPVVNVEGKDVHQITGTANCPDAVWWSDPSKYVPGSKLDAREPPEIPFVFEARPVPTVHFLHDSCPVKHRTMAAVESCPRRSKTAPSAVSRHET